jgi:hypothetical protein
MKMQPVFIVENDYKNAQHGFVLCQLWPGGLPHKMKTAEMRVRGQGAAPKLAAKIEISGSVLSGWAAICSSRAPFCHLRKAFAIFFAFSPVSQYYTTTTLS